MQALLSVKKYIVFKFNCKRKFTPSRDDFENSFGFLWGITGRQFWEELDRGILRIHSILSEHNLLLLLFQLISSDSSILPKFDCKDHPLEAWILFVWFLQSPQNFNFCSTHDFWFSSQCHTISKRWIKSFRLILF